MSPKNEHAQSDGDPSAQKKARRRKLWRRWLGWGIPVVVIAYIAVLGVSAFFAYSAVKDVIPLAGDVQDAISTGDTAAAQQAVDEVADKTAVARASTDHIFWRGIEWLPVVGDDIQSVRLAAAAADDLVNGALKPFATVDIAAIGPTDGAINLDAVASLADPTHEAAQATERVQIDLMQIDTATLLAPVEEYIGQLTDTVGGLWPTLNRLDELMPHLPTMLGAEGPRNYLVMVQNNAEARSTGGNPASIMMLTADQGRISITQQASSTDFNNGRPDPILPLSDSTEALYTDRVGRYIQDSSMTPDFEATAALVRANWEQVFGDPGTGVLSIDPVALGYILKATGGIQMQDGSKLTADNAADVLLNRVYFTYENNTEQDAYFAAASGAIFEKITSGSADIVQLATAIGKASGEGRILYSSTDPIEASVIDGTKLTGPLSDGNDKATEIGVFVNDTTEGKLDYYANMSVSARSNVCEAEEDEAPTFTVDATYNYTLQPDEAATLPFYISTGRYFERGVKATSLVFYGPVGGTWESATLDGADYVPVAGTTDLGRPAVRIYFENTPGTSHDVSVTFSGPAGEDYGPLDVVHTPLIDPVPVDTSSPGC